MIADSHAHAFPPMGGPSGHSSIAEHMKYVQLTLMFHHQPSLRTTDNVEVPEQMLVTPNEPSIEGLTKVNMRGSDFGKFTWTVDSSDYTKQYLPPSLNQLEAPPELMIAQMDYAGVDKAVLQTGHVYGRLNEYLSEAVKKYPNRFWGLAMVDEWKVDQPSEIYELEHSISDLGLTGLWFQSSNLRQHGRTETLDDPIFFPFWDRVNTLNIPVFWFVTSAFQGKNAYLSELASFTRWLQRYPKIPVVLTHGLLLSRFIENGKVRIPEVAWEPLRAPNVSTEILIPIFQGALWDYPYKEAHPILREYYDRMGAERMMWGSDMPNVERHCTYKQSRDYLSLYCDFITKDDMAKICGGNLRTLFKSVS